MNSWISKSRFIFLLSLGISELFGQNESQKFTLRGVNDTLLYSLSIQDFIGQDITSIQCNGNELKVFDVRGITATKIHANTFLEIQFWVRGGTGGRIRRSVLVCLLNGKLFSAMDFYSESVWRLSEVYDKMADSLRLFDEESDYYTNLSIEGIRQNWQANLLESLKIESKHDPSQNTSFEKSFNLAFDINDCFFYNSYKQLDGTYQIHFKRGAEKASKFFREEVPCIQLNQYSYLLINKEWYLFNEEKYILSQR